MARNEGDRQAMPDLLEKFLVGADRAMISVGHWADRLLDESPTPLAIRFLDQLDAEWLEAAAPDAMCVWAAAQVRRHLSATHNGWPHLWGHTIRVIGGTLAIAEEEGIDPVLAYLVGVLHDVAKLDPLGDRSHEELGAAFAGQVLHSRLPAADLQQIQAAIVKDHDAPLGQALHDADKLDKIGAAGVLRRISTDTRTAWIPTALDRVADDREQFPAMLTVRGRDLAESKLAFLDWFLPPAQAASADWM